MMKKRKYVSFDTETTGFDPEKCQVIELAAEVCDEDFNILDRMDMLIRLPEGEVLPEKIVELTGITDAMLETEGVAEEVAAKRFSDMLSGDEVILVAHNAQFDINFVAELFRRNKKTVPDGPANLGKAEYLDTLTIAKDRKLYPHRLKDMIEYYNLQAENTHRAIDDAHGVTELLKAFIQERDDVFAYLNLFGVNPKYGINGNRLLKVTYRIQPYRNGANLLPSGEIMPLYN